MALAVAIFVWFIAVSSGDGANSACAALTAVFPSKAQQWIGYPLGWDGYDDGRGHWVWLPIDDLSGLLIIYQDNPHEAWLFVMRSTDNHDFCGPYLF